MTEVIKKCQRYFVLVQVDYWKCWPLNVAILLSFWKFMWILEGNTWRRNRRGLRCILVGFYDGFLFGMFLLRIWVIISEFCWFFVVCKAFWKNKMFQWNHIYPNPSGPFRSSFCKITPCLKLSRIMLEISNFARKYTHM